MSSMNKIERIDIGKYLLKLKKIQEFFVLWIFYLFFPELNANMKLCSTKFILI